VQKQVFDLLSPAKPTEPVPATSEASPVAATSGESEPA
jgi:hypothetical protein